MGETSSKIESFVKPHRDGTVLEVSVRPKAGGCRVALPPSGRARIEVKAAPEGGRATEEALQTLAKALRVPKEAVRLISGGTSRHKTILVYGLSPDECVARLYESERKA